VVYLIGAGPGDPGLITVAGRQRLAEADVVVYDALANPALLAHARPDAELIDAGKRARRHKLTQDQTNALLAEKALAGKTVARLKGGDPYVFGRGGEEAIYLHARGVPAVVIPGIPAALAGPAYAGIPITHRHVATTCTWVTGHEDPTKDQTQVEYAPLAALASRGGTLCFYMGMGRLPGILAQLRAHGLAGETPAAVVQWGTLPRQRSVRGTVDDLEAKVQAAGLSSPAIIVVGAAAGLDEPALQWFESRPLHGRTVAVTRTRQQASALRRKLEDRGASVLETPTIAIEPPEDRAAVRAAVRSLPDYDWLVLTSPNGVAGLAEALDELGLDARHLHGVRIATVGRATTEALGERLRLRPDFVPEESMGEALAAELIAEHPVAGQRFLLLRADIARPALREKLIEAGAEVDDVALYHTRPIEQAPEALVDALAAGEVDWITFTSGSTARNLHAMLGEEAAARLSAVRLASIGPTTSAALRELGLEPTVEADPHDIGSLVQALLDAEQDANGGG